MSVISRSSAILDDPSAMNMLTAGSRRKFDQLDRGRFEAKISHLSLATSSIASGKVNRELIESVTSNGDALHVGVDSDSGSLFNGETLDNETVTIHWGQEQKCFHIKPTSRFITVELDTHSKAGIREELMSELIQISDGKGALLVKHPAVRRSLLFYLAAAEYVFISGIPGYADKFDAAFSSHFWGTLEKVIRTYRPETLRVSYPRQLKLFMRARDFLYDRDSAIVNVAQLAKAAGVSERALSDSFQSVVQRSPRSFMRLFRLNRARTYIKEWAPYLDNVVTEAAVTYGFWHLGRFSAYYQWQFGEYPSDTARRTSDS